MEILLVRSELGPWIGSDDGAEALGVYGKTLRQLGHEVTIVSVHHPAYEQKGLLVARRLTPLVLPSGRAVTVYDAQLATGVRLVLLGLPQTAESWLSIDAAADGINVDAAASLAHAVAALVAHRAEQGRRFDAVHLYDWCTALVGLTLREFGAACPRIVLSVTDPSQTGFLRVSGSPEEGQEPLLSDRRLACSGGLSLLKAGVLVADVVALPSVSLVSELRTAVSDGNVVPWGELGDKLVGIAEGVDYARVNPATSPALPSRFDAFDTTGKSITKTAYLRECGFDLEDNLPLLLVPGPLGHAYGSDVAAEVVGALDPTQVRVVVLQTEQDEPQMAARFQKLAERAPSACRLGRQGDAADLQRALGAADLVLLPRAREPLGVRHLMAMRYGAAPVAAAVGAMRDGIVDADASLSTGYGFLFESPADALGATQRAIAATAHPGWDNLRRRMMRLDLGWDRPARRIAQLYRPTASLASSVAEAASES